MFEIYIQLFFRLCIVALLAISINLIVGVSKDLQYVKDQLKQQSPGHIEKVVRQSIKEAFMGPQEVF